MAGALTKAAQGDTGLSGRTRLYLGGFDHPSAARASGVNKEGRLLISCGTSWVCFFPYGNRDRIIAEHFLCDPFLIADGGLWGAMFSLEQAGKRLDADIERIAGTAPDRFDIFESMVISGVPPAVRAAEHIADQLKQRLNKLKADGIAFTAAVMAGGPSNSTFWPQYLSKKLNIHITVKHGAYSGAVGAAMLCQNNGEE